MHMQSREYNTHAKLTDKPLLVKITYYNIDNPLALLQRD